MLKLRESIMGNPISKVRAEAKAADETAKQQMEERMNILEKLDGYFPPNKSDTQYTRGTD